MPGPFSRAWPLFAGVAGGFLGGYIGSHLGLGTVTGFNLGSLLVATGGAVLLLFVYRVLRK